MDKSGKAELSRERKDKRSRSRSPKTTTHSRGRRSPSPPSRDRKRSSKHHYRDERRRSRSRSSSSSSDSSSDDYSRRRQARKSSEQQKPNAPPPPKISMSLAKGPPSGGVSVPFKKPIMGISLKLNAPPAKSAQPKITVANAFNNDSDEEVEEMPAECKMRMKNIGRMTPTSSGPNSFGKTKLGFVDTKKMHEKKLQEMMNQFGD